MPGDASAVCTLFEGHYHFGLASFVNSLHAHGYRGGVWAGYRGALPPWARSAVVSNGLRDLKVAAGLTIHFVPVETDRQMINFKADFLIGARQRFFPDAENVFYFDPDLVLRCSWPFFEEWASYGVALCEDINSPMPSTHPLRAMWQRFYAQSGFKVTRNLDVYVNAGFVGVSRADWEFIETWKQLMDAAGVVPLSESDGGDRRRLFDKRDQDALNVAVMVTARPVSIVGKDGMDLVPGGFLLSHALGEPKTWRKNFLGDALRGFPPTRADREFFNYAHGPLRAFSPVTERWKRLNLSLACGVARFYSRR